MTHEELRGHGDAIKEVAKSLARAADPQAFGPDAPGQWVPGVRVMVARDNPVVLYHFITRDSQEVKAPFDVRWFDHPDARDLIREFFLTVRESVGEHKLARGPVVVH